MTTGCTDHHNPRQTFLSILYSLCLDSVQHCLYQHNIILLINDEEAQMNSSNPRAGWEKVGDQFYRKIQLYESVFDPDLELENYLVAGAPYGGAIGMASSSHWRRWLISGSAFSR